MTKYRLWIAASSAIVVASAALTIPSAWAVSDQAPRDVRASAGDTGGTASVRWAAPSNAAGLAGYTIVALEDDGNELVTSRANAPANSLGPTTISGLTNGEEYTFVVYARYAGGNHASAPSGKVTPYTTPNSPARPTAERTAAGSVRVSWTAPSDGGSAITSYTVECSPTCTETTVTDLFADVSGLTQTVEYTFTVKATNARGSSTASTASTGITPFGLPGAPRSVTASAGDASIAVSWRSPDSNGGSPITGYTATASPGARTCQPLAGQVACTITGLTNGTTYTVDVVATNAAGSGSSAQATGIRPVGVPGRPTGVTVTAGDGRATVSWTAPASDGGSAITGYTVTSAPDQRTCTTAALTCDVTDLTNGQSYTFTVKATSALGTGVDSEASAAVVPSRTVTAPGAPLSVAASTGSAPRTIDVTWTAPSSNGGSTITGYAVAVATSLGGPWTTAAAALPSSARSYSVGDLAQGTGYFVRVAAVNSSGTGTWLATTSATLPKVDPNPGPAPGPAPGPGPAPSPTGSASPSPSPSPSVSPSPSPSPSESPSPEPSPTPTPAPAPPPGLAPITDPPDRTVTVRKSPSRQASTAPQVSVRLGSTFALRVQGLPTRVRAVVSVRATGGWQRLGTARSSGKGTAQLPTLESSRAGKFLVRMAPMKGAPLYLRVVVVKGRASHVFLSN